MYERKQNSTAQNIEVRLHLPLESSDICLASLCFAICGKGMKIVVKFTIRKKEKKNTSLRGEPQGLMTEKPKTK